MFGLVMADADCMQLNYHIRSAPYHSRIQVKIERYHRSMKNVVKLRNYSYPWELSQVIETFVEYCTRLN